MGRFAYELIKLIKQFRLDFRSPPWKEHLEWLELGLYPENYCQLLLDEAKIVAERIRDQGIYLWRPPTVEELEAEGPPDIELGNLIEGDQQRFGFCYKNRPRNILIIGSAGGGKTVTCKKICIGIDECNLKDPDHLTHLIIIDPKTDYCGLKHILKDDVLLLSAHHNLRIGLNGPRNVPPIVWIGVLSICLAARLCLVMSRILFSSILIRLLVSLNPWLDKRDLNNANNERPLQWPSLAMVLEAIKIKRVMDCFSSKASYGETLIQSLTGFLQDSGDIFNCSNGLDIHGDIIINKRHCIIEVPNVAPAVVRFITDIVISHELVSRLYHNYKCDHTDVFFVVDEGDLLVEEERELLFADGMSPGSKANRLGRELGIGTIFLISALQKAGEHILRNASYSFVFNLGDAQSVRAACHHLQLDPRCQRLLGSLRPGQCIFRQTQAFWSSAMWCEIDYIAPGRNLGIIEYQSHQYTPAISLSDVPHVLADLDAVVEEDRKAKKRQSSTQPKDQDDYGLRLLRLRAANPYIPVARIMEALGKLRFDAQVAIREKLESEGLAEFEEIRIGRSKRLLMDITTEGYKALGLPEPEGNKGRGNISHRHFAHWIKRHFQKQEKETHIEWVIPGSNHPVDVAVLLDNGWIVFEVCVTAYDNVLSHLKACFESGSDIVKRLTIVVTTKAKQKELKKQLQSEILFTVHANKIEFDVIENYIIKELNNYEAD